MVGVDKIDEILRKISDIITTKIEPNPQEEISSEIKIWWLKNSNSNSYK